MEEFFENIAKILAIFTKICYDKLSYYMNFREGAILT